MPIKSKQKICSEFKNDILTISTKKNENEIQLFLSEHPDLIPTPYLLNHGLHFDFIFSKLAISDSLKSDFAYLTKSSVEWTMVLMELEASNKKIFTENKTNINFSAEFNNAYDQILSWRAFLRDNKAEFKNKLKDIMSLMFSNKLTFQFVLIIGRSSELTTTEKKNLFAEKNTDGIRVMTYDSLTRTYLNNRRDHKNLISKVKNGFELKKYSELSYSSAFAYLNKDNFFFDSEIEKRLIKQGYDIKSWKKGIPLSLNGKLPFKGFLKTTKEDLMTREIEG